MAVPVRPRVLMPEADDMAQFMDHDAKLVTILADGDGLRAPATATHVRAAPGGRGQLRGAVPSWGSASTQGAGRLPGGRGSAGAVRDLGGMPGLRAQGQFLGERPMTGGTNDTGPCPAGAATAPRPERELR